LTFRAALPCIAAALVVAGCKPVSSKVSDDAAAPAATARVIVEDFKPLEGCSCPGFELAWRPIREEDDMKAEPARRHHVVPEFRISGGGKTWVFKPASECAFPQRLFANTLKLGLACTSQRLVIAGPHWASAFSVGRESWTRRIDGDPSLADDLLRPMLKPAGVGPPEWGAPERPNPSNISITCERLTLDGTYVQIADWGGNSSWFDTMTGRPR